jgi:hypothetical protein
MWTKQKGFYKSNMLSTCGGMSGSGLIDSKNVIVAVHAGHQTTENKQPNQQVECIDVGNVPNLTSEFDPKTCEKETGGASLGCLSDKLPA